MGLGHLCGWALSTMANDAAPVFDVVGYRRMGAKRFGDRHSVLQSLFGHSHVTRRAAIDHAKFRQPDLLNSPGEMVLQDRAIGARGNKLPVLALGMPPLIKEVFGRSNRQSNQKQQARPSKTTNWRCDHIPAQPFTHPLSAQGVLHGHTQTQPGPRKSAPTVVRITASIKNHVMIQKESGLALNQF
jgi:hypothetical protein